MPPSHDTPHIARRAAAGAPSGAAPSIPPRAPPDTAPGGPSGAAPGVVPSRFPPDAAPDAPTDATPSIPAPIPPDAPAPVPPDAPAGSPSAAPGVPPHITPILVAAAGLAALTAAAVAAQGPRGAIAAGLGAAAGAALWHARFGFGAAWRRMAEDRRGAGLRAQMLLIGLICAASFPLMAWGDAIGLPTRGVILPMGLASALGAAMFGAGMHIGGGCASGTLYAVGGGSARMAVTLAFFVAGSVWATAHWDLWASLPRTRAGVSLPQAIGTLPALGAVLAGLGAIALGSVWVERRAHGALAVPAPGAEFWRGPWSLTAGASALALVGIGCFALLERPWGVTAAFALWGAKAAQALGAAPEGWTYWTGWRAAQLSAPLAADATSVMNGAIMLGALGAAGAAGRRARSWRLAPRDVATAALGGLLMGYGARLAHGCNIGAYLGGLTSGSLHGLWWLVWAVAGYTLSLRAKAWLGR